MTKYEEECDPIQKLSLLQAVKDINDRISPTGPLRSRFIDFFRDCINELPSYINKQDPYLTVFPLKFSYNDFLDYLCNTINETIGWDAEPLPMPEVSASGVTHFTLVCSKKGKYYFNKYTCQTHY